MFLAADIGGTKSLLGIFDDRRDGLAPVRTVTLTTAEAAAPEDLIARFLGEDRVQAMTVAAAGAVVAGTATGSNLPWTVSQEDLRRRFGCPVSLINDLHAIAGYVPHAPADEFAILQPGSPVANGPIGVIAPGTGIGQSMLFRIGETYRPLPSEAGHIDFAPNTPRQDRWLDFLRQRHGHVSLERACSGSSLPAMYDFVAADSTSTPDAVVAARIAAAPDSAPVITAAAIDGRCEVCAETVGLFIEILAAAAGNLALQIVATGGIVLAGGIPPRILPALQSERFIAAFNAKGRFEALARRVPVRVLLNADAGLLGAAWMHARLLPR